MRKLIDNDGDFVKTYDDRVHKRATELIFGLGVHADLIGFHMLADAITLYVANYGTTLSRIYGAIAEKYDIKLRSVMLETSFAVRQAAGIIGNLSALIGSPIFPSDIRSSFIIITLATYIKCEIDRASSVL